MKVRRENLDSFIKNVDGLQGGISSSEFNEKYKNFTYQSNVKIDQLLDPYSSEYLAQMLELHKEITGREYDLEVDELTDFNLDEHIHSPNAYGFRRPADVALAFQRLAFAMRSADLPIDSSILDMGCGWGLSSELFAQMGFSVTAVDINPRFIELVSKRALRHGYNIQTHVSSFQNFESTNMFDAVVFYECFHHEQNPFLLLEKLIAKLNENGKVIFVSEPIQDLYWKNWGLRLDALSIYCMKKFGWFESGWSHEFFMEMIAKCGCIGKIYKNEDPAIGHVVILERKHSFFSANEIADTGLLLKGWLRDSKYIISNGESSARLWVPKNSKFLNLMYGNFRGKQIELLIVGNGVEIFKGKLEIGENILRIPLLGDGLMEMKFDGEAWNPNLELCNGDNREISFHLSGLNFE